MHTLDHRIQQDESMYYMSNSVLQTRCSIKASTRRAGGGRRAGKGRKTRKAKVLLLDPSLPFLESARKMLANAMVIVSKGAVLSHFVRFWGVRHGRQKFWRHGGQKFLKQSNFPPKKGGVARKAKVFGFPTAAPRLFLSSLMYPPWRRCSCPSVFIIIMSVFHSVTLSQPAELIGQRHMNMWEHIRQHREFYDNI